MENISQEDSVTLTRFNDCDICVSSTTETMQQGRVKDSAGFSNWQKLFGPHPLLKVDRRYVP